MANLIKGDAVTNATSYTLHKKATTDAEIDATPIATQESGGTISFNLDELVNATPNPIGYGAFQFAVKAHADGYLSSEYSNLSDVFEIPDPSILSLGDIKASIQEWKNVNGVGTINPDPVVTLEADYVTYTPENRRSIVTFSTLPLNIGSEVDCTVTFPTNASNICVGFNQDVSETNNWGGMSWSTGDLSSVLIPDSHIWFTYTGAITYLERGTKKYRAASPAKSLTADTKNPNAYRVKLKVLTDGFEIFQGSESEPIFTMTKEKSNPYLTHTTTPVYFCISTSTGVSLKIHGIRKL